PLSWATMVRVGVQRSWLLRITVTRVYKPYAAIEINLARNWFGSILHTCQKSKAGIKTNRWGEPWFYLDEDLERLRPPLKPGTALNPALGGRPRDPQKKKACEFCYRQLAQGRDPKAILEAAQARFRRRKA